MKNIVLSSALIAVLGLTACGPSTQSGHFSSGGGGGAQTYSNGWAARPDLVNGDGSVKMNPGEVKTDHPSTSPGDFGFSGNGPPSIDG